jgi:uncharacterized protein YdeI (YjbR/CyaY-like superfamily)
MSFEAMMSAFNRKDPIKNEKRYLIEVDVAINHVALPEQYVLTFKGLQQVVISKSEWPRVQALVETRYDLVEQAREINRLNLREWVKGRSQVEPHEDESMWTPEQLKKKATYPGSVEAEFHKLSKVTGKRRGILPLRSARIVEELDAPQDERTALIRDVAGQLSGASSNSQTAQLIEQVARLTKHNEEMQARLDEIENRRAAGRPRKE